MEIKFQVTNIILNYVENFDKIDFKKNNKFFLDISQGKNHDYKLSECSKEAGESVLVSFKYCFRIS